MDGKKERNTNNKIVNLRHHTLLGHKIICRPIHTLLLTSIPRIPCRIYTGRSIIVKLSKIDGHISRSAKLTFHIKIFLDFEGSTVASPHGGGGCPEEGGDESSGGDLHGDFIVGVIPSLELTVGGAVEYGMEIRLAWRRLSKSCLCHWPSLRAGRHRMR